jgi:hypothetical protein
LPSACLFIWHLGAGGWTQFMDLRCLLWVQNSNISTKIIEKKKNRKKRKGIWGEPEETVKKKKEDKIMC